MLEELLPYIAVWGLVFAVLNLYLTTEKHLRDRTNRNMSRW